MQRPREKKTSLINKAGEPRREFTNREPNRRKTGLLDGITYLRWPFETRRKITIDGLVFCLFDADQK